MFDTHLDTGIVRCLACWRHGGSNGIEINVAHTTQDRFLIKKRLRFEPRFPEMPGTVVFFVSPPGNPFIEHVHEPADAVESGTPGVDQGVECFLLVRFERFIVTEFMRDFSTAEILCQRSTIELPEAARQESRLTCSRIWK